MNLITSAKFAFRQLWKNRTVSVLNLIGLAFSIACCVVIGMYVIHQLSFDDFHKNGNRIYRVTETQKQPGGIFQAAVTPGPLAPALIKDFPEISRAVRIGSWSGTLKYGKTVIDEKQMLLTEPSFFSMFTFSALMGNVDDFLKSDQDMVITEDAAVRLFGSDWKKSNGIIGETVTFNGEQDFRVAGVVANPPANSSINFSVLLPLSYLFKTDEWSNNWGSNNYHTYIEVKPGSDMPAFEVKARDQLKKYVTNTEDKLGFQPLSRQYLYSKFDFNTDWGIRSNIKYVQIFSAVGLILLIIACVNFVNLSTAGAIRRSLEVGVRKVNGASRRQLVFQFLGETILLSSLAGLLAIILISLTRPYFLDFTGIDLEIDFTQPVFIGLLVGFVLVIGVLAGAYPA
ncbi:MAG: ABC transporter permease, partial [Chitinophagaceae bacterium]